MLCSTNFLLHQFDLNLNSIPEVNIQCCKVSAPPSALIIQVQAISFPNFPPDVWGWNSWDETTPFCICGNCCYEQILIPNAMFHLQKQKNP